MRRIVPFIAAICLLASPLSRLAAQTQNGQDEILKAREAVWQAWFANDVPTLHQLVPAETIVFSSDEAKWKNQADIFRTAAEFQSQGGKPVRLEFPRTEIQRFGDVAVVWSNFLVETEESGKRSIDTGRASEIFVYRGGRWINPGWHTDPKSDPKIDR
ncbi:MAG: nuclear transport factor 2 family protein [Terracidiphilus sp.]